MSFIDFPNRLTRGELLRIALAIITMAVLDDGPALAQQPRAIRLRILCYNIHHGEGTDGKVDLPRLATVIRNAKPDLVALQEVDHRTERTHGIDQTAELARLTGLYGRFGKQIDYEGGGYGQAILSRFPIDELTLHVLPGMPERQQRLAAEARLAIDGMKFSFVTTHLHHISEEFRTQQAERLNDLFAAADHPVILAGDLNATPGSPPLMVLTNRWTIATSNPALLTYPAEKPVKQIDYVLIRPAARMRAISAEVVSETEASDHRPVLSVIELLSLNE